MAFDAGVTVRTSSPLAVLAPEILSPSRQVFSSICVILVGVVALRVAVPPVMEREKSLTSRLPLPPFELKTSSVNSTSTVVLSLVIPVIVITGAWSSWESKVKVLM